MKLRSRMEGNSPSVIKLAFPKVLNTQKAFNKQFPEVINKECKPSVLLKAPSHALGKADFPTASSALKPAGGRSLMASLQGSTT